MTITLPAKVLIIGCGPAGLGAIHQFERKGFDVVAYEARATPGGLWNFDPSPAECQVKFDADGHAIALTAGEHAGVYDAAPTPMYNSVRANTPRDIMTYRSHPYPEGTPYFPDQQIIKSYLDERAQLFSRYIRYSRVVTRVRHANEGESSAKRWIVEWTPSASSGHPDIGKSFREEFDHIVVANGTDTRPYIPYIEGLWNFKGSIVHSRWYRTPEVYAGKTVLVIGSGPSSADIVRELSLLRLNGSGKAPKKVYRSFRPKELRYDIELELGWRESVINCGLVESVQEPSSPNSLGRIHTTASGDLDDVDVIVTATGYVARFEFLHPTDAPFSKAPLLRAPRVPAGAPRPPSELATSSALEGGHRVHNLDQHQLFYLPDPSLAFLLLHHEAIPWPFSEMQARVVAAYWSGTPLELKPHAEEESDEHSVLVLGHPGEFVYAERLLGLIGEGGPEEVDAKGKWGQWPEWKKEIRASID